MRKAKAGVLEAKILKRRKCMVRCLVFQVRWIWKGGEGRTQVKRTDGEDIRRRNGGIAQLGEHLPCKQGVMSSNLIISTKRSETLGIKRSFADLHLENRI